MRFASASLWKRGGRRRRFVLAALAAIAVAVLSCSKSPTAPDNPPNNQSPTASASANPTSGVAPLMVSFNGSGSDPDGMIASYSWVFGDGGSSTQQNPSYTYSSGGAYAATLTATDNGGATASANVPIWVGTPGGTLPPTANAGADQSNLDPGVTVTLNGAGSTDPNGDALTYQWTQLTGPMVTLSGPNTAAPSFVAPLATTAIYTFRLTVMDNGAPPLGAQDLVNVSTRVTYNNTIQAWFADRGTQPNGEKLGCAIAGCHVPGTDRVPLTNYQEVFAERTKNRNRLAPGGSMRKYMLLTPRSEPDSTVKWLDNGAPQMN